MLSGKNELAPCNVVHCECRCINGNFSQVLPFALYVCPQPELFHFCFNRLHQLFYQWTLNAGPIVHLVDQYLAVFAKKLDGWANIFSAAPGYVEDVVEIGVERKLSGGELLIEGA